MLPQPSMTVGAVGPNEYTVQVGSFATRQEAYWESGRLRGLRINNFIMQRDGKWLVCVGRYWTGERAERRKDDLNNRYELKAVVLPPKPLAPKPPPKPKSGCQ